jgi:hypothetical protein
MGCISSLAFGSEPADLKTERYRETLREWNPFRFINSCTRLNSDFYASRIQLTQLEKGGVSEFHNPDPSPRFSSRPRSRLPVWKRGGRHCYHRDEAIDVLHCTCISSWSVLARIEMSLKYRNT